MTAPITTNGTRLRCDSCKAEFIVLAAAPATLTCCSQPLTVLSAGRAQA